MPLSVCATGKGIHCKLVLRLFGFHFCGKTPLLKPLGKDERRGKLHATDIFISLLNYSDERESWKYFSDLKQFHFFGKVCAEVDSGILAGISQQLLPAFLQVCYKVHRLWCAVRLCVPGCFVSVTVPSPHFKF